MRRARPIMLAGAVAMLLAACGTSAAPSPPTWEPSPPLGAGGNGPGAQASPILPVPSPPDGSRPGAGSGPSGVPGPGSPTPAPGGSKIDPLVVATRLTAPVGLTLLPDGSALVGERTTGRIVRVQPIAGQPVPTVRVLRGLDTRGDGGLLDLALSPTYDEDGLIYAYVTTRTDNRVVDFTLKGPVTPVVTGIPKGRTGNTGRITFGGDGDLYIGTGDAGHPSAAANPHSLAGKVLRVDDIGDPAPGNPAHASPIWTSGHHVVNGLCALPRTTAMLEVEGRGSGIGDVNELVPGSFYGWPSGAGIVRQPIAQLPDTARAPGGCAVLDGRLWVSSLDGRELVAALLKGHATGVVTGPFFPALANRYGRLKTVVAAPDGALWITTSNRDGHGKPVPADERVIRWVPSSSGAGKSPV
jgi:glucose/arabinose dehydrogenase